MKWLHVFREAQHARCHSRLASNRGPWRMESPESTGTSWFVRLCAVVSHTTRLCAIFSMFCAADLLAYSWGSMTRTVLHCYTVAFAAVALGAESEWPPLLRAVPFLEPWALRGFFHVFVGVLVQTGAFLDVTALEDSAGPMGSDSTGMSSSSKLGFPSGGGVGNRVTTAHDPAELAARNGPPAPPNSGSSSASSSGISGGSVGGLNSVSPGMGDLLSPGGSAVGGDTQASAGELIVLACMVCSYGLIGAGLLHTILGCLCSKPLRAWQQRLRKRSSSNLIGRGGGGTREGGRQQQQPSLSAGFWGSGQSRNDSSSRPNNGSSGGNSMSRSGSSSENYSKSSRSNNKHSSGNEDRFGGYVEAELVFKQREAMERILRDTESQLQLL